MEPARSTTTPTVSRRFPGPEPLAIPWGSGLPVELDLPSAWPAPEVAEPDLSGALDDYPSALLHALDQPEGGRRVEDGVKAGTKVAIVVDDPSRWTPVSTVLPIVVERLLGAGVGRKDVSVSVGVGRHHAVDAQSMRKRVGDAILDVFPCHSPPVDDLSQYNDLGTTASGIPIRVFRPVAEADVRILVGSVLPHLQAGFGGGYKLIFPGTSHRSTLGALHRSGLGGDTSGLLGGEPAENPMRKAIAEAAALLSGRCVSISHLMGSAGQVFEVASGDVDLVQARLSTSARRRFQAPRSAPADVVIAGNAPWPGDPMQSFKVLLNLRAACRKGGVLVGFFYAEAGELDRSFPLRSMKMVASSGSLGGWAARRTLALIDRIVSARKAPAAFMVRWARELVVDRTVLVYSPLLRSSIGPRLGPIRIFDDQAALWDAVGHALGGTREPRVRVFPQGGLMYCVE